MSASQGARENSRIAGDCVSSVLPSDRLGAGFRSGAGLLHANVLRPAKKKGSPGGHISRQFDFQAAARSGIGARVPRDRSMEDFGWSYRLCCGTAVLRSAVLRSGSSPEMVEDDLERAFCAAMAGAEALPDALPAHILVDADSLDEIVFRIVPGHWAR